MSTRIRYNNVTDSTMVSRKTYSVSLDDNIAKMYVRVKLNLDNMTFTVFDASHEDIVVIAGGKTRNLTVLKRQAKKGLESLGIEFSSEVRVRGITLNTGQSEAT